MYAFKLNDGTNVLWNNITAYELGNVDPYSINENSIYKNSKQVPMTKLIKDVKSFIDSYRSITLESKFNLCQFKVLYKRITGIEFNDNKFKFDNNTSYTLEAWIHDINIIKYSVCRFELFTLFLEIMYNIRL